MHQFGPALMPMWYIWYYIRQGCSSGTIAIDLVHIAWRVLCYCATAMVLTTEKVPCWDGIATVVALNALRGHCLGELTLRLVINKSQGSFVGVPTSWSLLNGSLGCLSNINTDVVLRASRGHCFGIIVSDLVLNMSIRPWLSELISLSWPFR